MAGFDFGCNSDGICTVSAAWPPLTQYYGADGAGQMKHFVEDDGFNTFRLPVGWQFLVNDVLGGPIDEANFAIYDDLVQVSPSVLFGSPTMLIIFARLAYPQARTAS